MRQNYTMESLSLDLIFLRVNVRYRIQLSKGDIVNLERVD